MRLYLASRSPRRRELLRQIGVHFDLLVFRGGERGEESTPAGCIPEGAVGRELEP